MRPSAAFVGGSVAAPIVVALSLGACVQKPQDSLLRPAAMSFVPPQPTGPTETGPSSCVLLGVPLTSSTQWSYVLRRDGEVRAVEEISVSTIERGQALLFTSITTREERFGWSAVVDCATQIILEQQGPDFAYSSWPFPGIFAGQRLDATDASEFGMVVPGRRRSEAAVAVHLAYRDALRIGRLLRPPLGSSARAVLAKWR